MSYQLPHAIISQAKVGLASYWQQLKNNDRKQSQDWIDHLAKAKIYPLRVRGSVVFDNGLIDPDIVIWIEKLAVS